MLQRKDIRIRDPFIFVEDGIYYLLGSTGTDPFDGSSMTLYRSDDLVSFESVGCMLTQADMEKYPHIWAPELYRYQGKYYLLLTYHPDEEMLQCAFFVSDSLKKPFYPLTGKAITPEGWGCLDATLFLHEGKPYLYFADEWISPVTGDGDGAIYVCPISQDLTHLTGKPRKIISGKYCGLLEPAQYGDTAGYVAEGPYAVHENGKIALYWSGFTKDGYCVLKSVAKDIMGEYEFEKYVYTGDGGHGMVFNDLNNRQLLSFHQPNRCPLERLHLLHLE